MTFTQYDTATEECIPAAIDVPEPVPFGYELGWAPDGDHLLGWTHGTVHLYSASSGALLDCLSLPSIPRNPDPQVWLVPPQGACSQGVVSMVW